jgi:membrane fusion protein (multidrug efflux system)
VTQSPSMSVDGAAPERGARVPVFIGLLVVALLVLGQGLFHRAGAHTNRVALASAPKPVAVVEARSASYRPSRRYVGTLEPWLEARVGPQLIAAYVSTVLVRPGASVHRGDVLATLDCREASASSQAVALQARALQARQTALARQASRMSGLLTGGFVAPNEVEQRQAESDSEEARLQATRAQLTGTAIAVRDCVLRAPFDGEVTARLADPGAFMRPGGAIVDLVDRSIVRVAMDVPETDFDAVAPGTPLRLRLLSTGRELGGTIARRSPSADPSTRTVHVEVDLPNADRAVPVNTTAQIDLDVGSAVAASEIPLTAASVRGARATVFVVEGGVARSRTVPVLGERAGALFVGAELPPGARVVSEGRALLADGDRVAAHLDAAPGARP